MKVMNTLINPTFIELESPKYHFFKACNCNGDGSTGIICDDNGKCNCKANYMNDKCDACNVGFFNFPTCEGNQCLNQNSIEQQMIFFPNIKACNCNADGSSGIMCNGNGVCSCKPNFMNVKCDQCNVGFFNYPTCEGKSL